MRGNFLCIHGHFYQPPRENPWLEWVEPELSALPFHDWNERITRECYAPNAWARIHSPKLKIERLINNFSYISFDMGPTLISWIHQNSPHLYDKLLEADRESKRLYGGHGTAMAQAYNHMILPLADRKDKETQIRWGKEDFKFRFGRDPEGMWLPETAVDLETLEIMSFEGIRFTILSPYQAEKIRPLSGKASWKDVSDGSIDITMPYRVVLPSGRSIDVLFYNKEISQSIAFGNALSSGEQILKEVSLCLFKWGRDNGIVTIATDGESYGHHFKFGDLALAWMIEHAREFNIQIVSPGQYLEMFPPTYEVKVKERSSWSCAHGVKRWEDDCGCSLSGRKDWNQKWRRPLRDGLNWLRDEIRKIYEREMKRFTQEDPYEIRNRYIEVLLKREECALKDEVFHSPYGEEILRLLESQRMAMYMFTSCGWFFDDITGIEATQVLKYALRAIELLEPYGGKDLLEGLKEYLRKIKPNDPSFKDGEEVLEKLVKPSAYSKETLVGSVALCSLFGITSPPFLMRKFTIEREICHCHRDSQLRIGQVAFKEFLSETERFLYVINLHKGHVKVWTGKGELTEGMDGLILQGLELRASQRNVLSQLKSFLGSLKEVEPSSLPGEMIPTLILGGEEKGQIKDLNIEAGKAIYTLSLLEEKGILKDISRLNLLLPFPLQDFLEELIIKFFVNENLSADDIGLNRLLRFFKENGSSIHGGRINFYANQFIRRESNNLFKGITKNSIRKLLHYLKLHRKLRCEADLFYLQNYWWELSQNKLFLDKQSIKLKKLFWKLGEELGFVINK